MHKIRKQKVQSQLRKEISMLIMREVKDPRTDKLITVTNVSLTEDLKTAHVYVSVMGDDKEKEKAVKGLQHAAGFIRSRLGDEMRLQFTPDIKFMLDDTEEHRTRVLKLLMQIEESKPK